MRTSPLYFELLKLSSNVDPLLWWFKSGVNPSDVHPSLIGSKNSNSVNHRASIDSTTGCWFYLVGLISPLPGYIENMGVRIIVVTL